MWVNINQWYFGLHIFQIDKQGSSTTNVWALETELVKGYLFDQNYKLELKINSVKLIFLYPYKASY